ncbi:MAG: MATE family efflux transporter, partial [Planctomycetia bacterium]|nr:MATE family efflux transporter [Planctomycetia bacterium]
LAVGSLGQESLAGGTAAVWSAEAPYQVARQIMARQVAYQAAQTTANYLAWFISSYAVMVSVGGTALVSRCIGAGERDQANRAANQAVVLGVFVGLAGTVVGLLGLDTIIRWLQLRGDAAQFAADYLRPLLLLLVFQMVEQAGIASLVGAGDTRTGLLVLGGVALLNLPLAWGFYHGIGPVPGLGFAGIAWGTAVSHALGCLAVLGILAHGRARLRLEARWLVPDAGWQRRLLRVGLPAGFDSLSVATGHLWFLGIVNQLGDEASTAHGIALRWESMAYLSGGAFGVAAMTLVGQYLGARRPEQASRSGWTAFGLGCGVMCAMAAVFYVFAPEMFYLFCPRPEQRPVIAVGVPVLRLVAFVMPALASCIIFTSALRGAGDTRVPVLFTWVGFLGVRIPLAYWLTASLGLYGAWLAMCADLVVRGGFFLYRFASGRWKLIQV